jgi:predicted metal-binding membrane protein
MAVGPGTMGLGLPLFLVFWVVMMAAMMFPSITPVAVLWTRSIAGRTSGWVRLARTSGFVSGYLIAWSLYGVAAFAALRAVERVLRISPDASRWIGFAVFLAAGIYQLTPLKDVCLSHCRSPMVAFLHYANLKGRVRDLRVGLHHGAYCVGCCWGIMLVLVAVGVMNLPIMAALATVIALEKLWAHGRLLTYALGAGFLLLAGVALLRPELMPGLRLATDAMADM